MEKVSSAACAMDWSIKLEKALRSKNPDRAVEAILETGEKLEQWSKEPEPATAVYNLLGLVPEEDRLFYNTILLRLVDAFCCYGDKRVKVAVVRVFMSMFKLMSRGKDKSERETWYLSKAKVYNHLEILKRVKSVYDKGDSEAKALALILFGCWRDFASEFAPVRYLVFTSMVSSHDLEVRSSLFAAACFCEVADDFALVVLGMLNDMVKFPGIMPKTRLAAVRVFAKMGCSHAISSRAFKICMTLMLESSEEDSLVPFLVSLTKLASRSTHLASELAEVIMPFVAEDKSSHVRAAVLRCLHFLIKRGMCFSLAHVINTANCSSLLKQAELSPDMQLTALQIFQKILVYKLCMADASELHQHIAIVENASRVQIFSSSYLTISILVGIWKEIVRTAERRSVDLSSASLPLQLVVLVMDRLTLLARLCSDPCHVDSPLVDEVQDLFNVLHLLVGKHSEVRLLVLDKVRLFLEYIVNLTDGLRKTDGAHELLLGLISYKTNRGVVVKSELLASIHKFLIVFLEDLEGEKAVLSQVYENVKRVTECVRSCSFFDCHTQMIFALLLHSPILWGFPVNEMGRDNDADGDSVAYGIVSLECSSQILTERNYWPAYRAGVYAARLGAWVTSALIFDKLKTNNVQSDINSFWLKSLTYLSHAEGKLQLLLMPSDSFKLVNWLRSNSCLPELSKDASSGEFVHCVALHEAYMNLQSSLGMLGNIKASSEVFCFQTWFLVLKTRVLETVIDLVECLGLLNQDTRNKKQVEENVMTGCNSLQQLPRICNQLQKLAKEFDMLATCFVDIDNSSSSIIAVLSLSCSVLAFAAGVVTFIPSFSFHETLPPFTSQTGVGSRLVQDLVQRLWKVDPEICEMLMILVKENESQSCPHLQPRNQLLKVSNKVKMLLTICRDALACIHGLQNWSNPMHEEDIMSEISKSCRNLLSQAIMKWMQIPFGIPKYFFNIRPCVGAELFALSSDSSKSTPDTISVEQGFQLPLDLCLQLKNTQQQPRFPVRLTKLYCLLYTKLAYHTLTQRGEAKRNQKSYSPWRDEDLVEMSNKLFHHAVTKSGKKPEGSGRFDWSNGVSAVVQLEPNERGQGFSSCLLDVSRFPVGSYQIKWLSGCIDQHGSYWNLLPLNGKPVFTVKKAS